MARSAKDSESGSRGQRDATAMQLLKKDHEKVKQLFHSFEKAGDRAYETKQKLVAEIEREIEAHTTIEEEIFYPAVQGGVSGTKDIVEEAFEEHNVAKSVLRELGAMSPEDEQYDAKVKVLQENIEHHVQEEEGEMFPKAEQLGSQRLKDLGAEMQARKEALGQPALKRIMSGVSGLIFGNGESRASGGDADEEQADTDASGQSSGTRARRGARRAGRSQGQNAGEKRQSPPARATETKGGKGSHGRDDQATSASGAGRSSAKSARSRTAKKTTGSRSQAQKRATTNVKKRGSGRSAEVRGTAPRRSSAKKQRTTNGASSRRRTTARKTAKKR